MAKLVTVLITEDDYNRIVEHIAEERPGKVLVSVQAVNDVGAQHDIDATKDELKAGPDKCRCVDYGCSHSTEGHSGGCSTLFRVDMEDNGALMCETCASDALESGVFMSPSEEERR